MALKNKSIYNILWSCLSTIFTCTWITVHPNIPALQDSRWAVLGRQVAIMGCILLVPEFVIYWAGWQHCTAHYFTKKFERNHPGWMQAHTFFLLMGGFTLHKEGKPVWVLEAKNLEELSEAGKIEWPTIAKEEIANQSKGDYLSKTIVFFQMTWFIIQCIARGIWVTGHWVGGGYHHLCQPHWGYLLSLVGQIPQCSLFYPSAPSPRLSLEQWGNYLERRYWLPNYSYPRIICARHLGRKWEGGHPQPTAINPNSSWHIYSWSSPHQYWVLCYFPPRNLWSIDLNLSSRWDIHSWFSPQQNAAILGFQKKCLLGRWSIKWVHIHIHWLSPAVFFSSFDDMLNCKILGDKPLCTHVLQGLAYESAVRVLQKFVCTSLCMHKKGHHLCHACLRLQHVAILDAR